MKTPNISGIRCRVALCGAAVLLAIAPAGRAKAQEPAAPPDTSAALQVPIRLSQFELFSVGGRPRPKAAAPASRRPQPAPEKTANLTYAEDDPPPVQAKRLTDAFSTALTDFLQKSGYAVTQGGDGSQTGVLLRGVFAEADDQNRIRRALLGAGSTKPNFLLYVAVFNLAHQDQPFYVNAPVQDGDTRFGPVITLNAYIPMMKFELPKDPSDEDIRKICGQVVSQLTQLLAQNPNAVTK